MKHHPQLYAAGRHGCWCRCSCGWNSTLYTAIPGAHYSFGQHLLTTTAALPTTSAVETTEVTEEEVP